MNWPLKTIRGLASVASSFFIWELQRMNENESLQLTAQVYLISHSNSNNDRNLWQCKMQNKCLAYQWCAPIRYLWGWQKLSLCLSCCLLSRVEGASAVASDTDHRRLLFKTSEEIYSSHCAMLTLALNPLQQQFILQTITINSLHIWQSRRTTYKWYASPAGPMATALTLLLRFFDPAKLWFISLSPF